MGVPAMMGDRALTCPPHCSLVSPSLCEWLVVGTLPGSPGGLN